MKLVPDNVLNVLYKCDATPGKTECLWMEDNYVKSINFSKKTFEHVKQYVNVCYDAKRITKAERDAVLEHYSNLLPRTDIKPWIKKLMRWFE